jgi:hypothetical protein
MMRKRRLYLIAIAAALILIQFIRPEMNLGDPDCETDFIRVSQVPDTLARTFLRACYDCHSNHTQYPWYGHVAPFSWYLSHHIKEGKDHLNLSSWGITDKAQKIKQLDEICEEIESGSMPLKSYALIHRSSKLSERDVQSICSWAETESLKILTGD